MTTLKYFIKGSITLSAPLYTHDETPPRLAGKAEYTLYIRIPIGSNGEISEVLAPTSASYYINTDSTRVCYNFVPTRAGTHYYLWLLANPSSTYQKDFVVNDTQFVTQLA